MIFYLQDPSCITILSSEELNWTIMCKLPELKWLQLQRNFEVQQLINSGVSGKQKYFANTVSFHLSMV